MVQSLLENCSLMAHWMDEAEAPALRMAETNTNPLANILSGRSGAKKNHKEHQS